MLSEIRCPFLVFMKDLWLWCLNRRVSRVGGLSGHGGLGAMGVSGHGVSGGPELEGCVCVRAVWAGVKYHQAVISRAGRVQCIYSLFSLVT